MLTELIPLALVVALSPLSIIPAVLVLHTPRPRPTGLAFLAGWLVGLAALTAIFRRGVEPVRWPRQATGLGVVAAHRRRRRVDRVRHLPMADPQALRRTRLAGCRAWASSPRPGPALAALALTVVNPKVLFICAAAGLAIGTAGPGHAPAHGSRRPGTWRSPASTVAIPILAYAVSGDRLDEPLRRLKDWMERQHATLVAAILIVIGLLVLYKGIHGL